MDDQAEIIAFLASTATYPGVQAPVTQIETHGALVFLAGDDAYKIKRAVRFDYMDFSTLERRRAAIEREYEINRPNAPEIYLGVAPITREPDGALQIGGTGGVVEWALHMRRFDQPDLLSAIAGRGALTPALARDLADAVFASHRAAPRCTDAQAETRMARIAGSLAHGLGEVAPMLAFKRAAFEAAVRQQLDHATACLRARGGAGFIARCHGDLHLNNIVLWNGVPTLFDAIEFDETLATTDTLYDLAFLLMDLDHRGHRQAANIVLNRYLARSGAALDIEGLAAMPLFLGLRSAVRALVTTQRALQEPAGGAARETDLAAARSSANDAMRYLTPPQATLIAVGGLSGTGKSTLAAAIAPAVAPPPGALHIRTDVERKSYFGIAETERLPAATYTRETSQTIYRRVLEKAQAALKAGHSVIVDAVFSDPQERAAIEQVARASGVPFRGLWLSAPRATLLARVAARTNDASDATADVVELQLRRGMGEVGWPVIDARGDVGSTTDEALRLIARTP